MGGIDSPPAFSIIKVRFLQISQFVILNRVKDPILAWQKQILRSAQNDRAKESRLLQETQVTAILDKIVNMQLNWLHP